MGSGIEVHGGDVGGETCEAEIGVAVGEDLGEVVRDGESLHSEAEVAADRNAVFTDPVRCECCCGGGGGDRDTDIATTAPPFMLKGFD